MQEGFGKQSSALKLKSSRGEIVEVQGGRILRSIGRKDRHSKVCTAKGPRDRRVRLSANTAIQFYDVQDRLGYGRPSEAIDWLMKEAKSAIDALAEKSPDQVPQPEQELEEQNNQCEFSNSGHEKHSHDEYLNQDPINSLSFFIPSSSSPSTEFQNLNFESTPANWYQRTINFAANSTSGNGEGRGGGYVTDTMPQWQQKVVLGQDQLFSQGGTLQSSYSPSFLALMNPQISSLNYDQMPEISPGTGNSFAVDGFSGFCASPRVRGEEERHNPVPNKPSSASCLLHFQD